jgi:Tol biopolymer transport system component
MLRKLNFSYSVATFLVFILSVSAVSGQSTRKILRNADQYIEVELYEDAIESLKPLVDKNNPEAILLTGFSMMALEEELPEAIQMLQKATDLYPLRAKRNKRQNIEAHFYLGQAYRLNGNSEKACEVLKNLQQHVSDPDLTEDISREIKYCENLEKMKNNPVDIKTEHLGKILNSPYEDHSPIVLYDESTIYFTSTRPLDTLETNTFFENIFVSHWRNRNWTEPKVLDIPGISDANRATVGVTPDGQGLIFYQNNGFQGGLYITRKTFNGWTEPEPLPDPINTGYNETHASFSPDGNTIYFSSERPGGFGGKDIYYSYKLPNGSWGQPINAGENINTPLNEEGPFIHPDDSTLYFSSEGHNSMGGYDIFKSHKKEQEEWSKAENIGYPINTPTDDLFYLPTPNEQRVYYASSQEGSLGQSDLFLIHFPGSHERSMAVVSSHVFNSSNQPAETATITVTNKQTNKEVGTYRVNPTTGKFVAIIPTMQQYQLSIKCQGHEPYIQSFELGLRDDFKSKNRAIYLPAITLKNNDPEK